MNLLHSLVYIYHNHATAFSINIHNPMGVKTKILSTSALLSVNLPKGLFTKSNLASSPTGVQP